MLRATNDGLARWAFVSQEDGSALKRNVKQKTGRAIDSIGALSEPSGELDPSSPSEPTGELYEILKYLSEEEVASLPIEAMDSMRDLVRGKKEEKIKKVKEGHTDEGPSENELLPHILATPAIADTEGDGDDELIVAASFYNGFDKAFA